jgi:hypothetical protein
MKVDFDNLRKQAAIAFNKVASHLNGQIDEEEGYVNGFRVREIKDEMDDLRSCIVAICCCYDDTDPDDNNDLSEWLANEQIASFAENSDDDE